MYIRNVLACAWLEAFYQRFHAAESCMMTRREFGTAMRQVLRKELSRRKKVQRSERGYYSPLTHAARRLVRP